MSSKRDLTGGTGDVNPQYLIIACNQTAANNYANGSVPIPINRFAQRRGKGMVLEVLKVAYSINLATSLNATGSQTVYYQFQLSTRQLTALNPADGTVIDHLNDQVTYYQPATATALIARWGVQPIFHDLTDNAGHGVIVATDQLYLWMQTAGFSNPIAGWAKIYYRFKEVSLEEYIGMVQSQQS